MRLCAVEGCLVARPPGLCPGEVGRERSKLLVFFGYFYMRACLCVVESYLVER